MTKTQILLAVLVAGCLVAGGCDKQIDFNVRNNSDMARQLQFTDPHMTSNLGTVGPLGILHQKVTVKGGDLPADCYLAAGPDTSINFQVTKDTPKTLWFKIGTDGKLTGPYDKNSVSSETWQTEEIQIKSGPRMIVK